MKRGDEIFLGIFPVEYIFIFSQLFYSVSLQLNLHKINMEFLYPDFGNIGNQDKKCKASIPEVQTCMGS